MCHELFVAHAHWADFSVDFFRQTLLGVAPAEAVAEFLTERGCFFCGCKSLIEHGERGAVRILRFSRQARIRDDARDRFVERFAAALKERNHVVVGLTHLAAVKPREHFNITATGQCFAYC